MRVKLEIVIRTRDGAHYRDPKTWQADCGEHHAISDSPEGAAIALICYMKNIGVLKCE